MKLITKILLIAGVIFLAKCSSLPKAPGDPEFVSGQKKWSDLKMEELKSGHTIYTTRCNACHSLKKIGDYDQATWTKLIDAMAPKAKLTDEESDDLRKYIYSARETSNSVTVKF